MDDETLLLVREILEDLRKLDAQLPPTSTDRSVWEALLELTTELQQWADRHIAPDTPPGD